MRTIPPSTITKTPTAIQNTNANRFFCSIAGSPAGSNVLWVASGVHAARSSARAVSPKHQSTFLRTFPLSRGSASAPAGARDARRLPSGTGRL